MGLPEMWDIVSPVSTKHRFQFEQPSAFLAVHKNNLVFDYFKPLINCPVQELFLLFFLIINFKWLLCRNISWMPQNLYQAFGFALWLL